MKRTFLILIFLLIALAAGAGIGLLISKSQVTMAQAEIEDLNSQLQEAQTRIEDTIKASTAESNRLNTELARSRNDIARLNTELTRTKTAVSQLKKALEQFTPQAQAPQPVSPSSEPTQVPPSLTAAARTSTPTPITGTREYTIKEGDSFWKIAANQLGSGARYKEIIELNPQIPPDKPLTIGTKIKIPAR